MPRLLCRWLQLKRMLNGTDMTVRRAAGSDKMNYRRRLYVSSPSTVSQSSGSANSLPETPYTKGGATTRAQHLTDPLAIAIAARDQWMFNDLLIGFWLFKKKRQTLSLFICAGVTHTLGAEGKLFKRRSSILMRCINVQIPWGRRRRGQGLSAWRRSDSLRLMMANCYANCTQKRTLCCPFVDEVSSLHVDGGII